ncbi:MAG: glucose-1-phosphate adenylyltransferase [Gammaproteobacteria bacterium]|nr:glucose-1-phosphate adenylyltransferase [Gammaproteobacteria bacterium]
MSNNKPSRFVSQLTGETLALILAGGQGSRLKGLTQWRSKPAVPFGGKFRIIDFPLSNCINSGIRRIGVLTQYKAHSLLRHLQQGWSFQRIELGEFVELLPAQQRHGNLWYEGTADAVFQNIDILRMHRSEYVLILAGDHIYQMDYGMMLAEHARRGADLTIACIEVSLEEAKSFGVMSVDDNLRVVGFDEKPAHPRPLPNNPAKAMASMGVYIFDTQFLYDQLIRDADDRNSTHDFGRDIIPAVIDSYEVCAYPFGNSGTPLDSYWRDVGTVDAYWQSNMELVGISPELNLYNRDWPIWTYQEQLPPAKFIFDDDNRRGMAVDSMVSGGCIISGAKLKRSLLFSNVTIHSYTTIEDSVVLPDVEVGRHCRIKKAIIDRWCKIPEGTIIGEDPVEDAKRFHISADGVVLVCPEMLGQEVHFVR